MKQIDRPRTHPASPALHQALHTWSARIHHTCPPGSAERFEALMLDTWETTMQWHEGRVFVVTGDIPAMWLRDSSAQVWPFMRLVDLPDVADTLAAIVAQQWHCISIDPYANAFNLTANGRHFDPEDLDLHPQVWERKYEIDSLAFPVFLAHDLWQKTGSTRHLTELVRHGCHQILTQWRLEQHHDHSPYRHIRPSEPVDTLLREGRGRPVAYTGMTWSGFRPSDDACTYGYNIPAQFMAASALDRICDFSRSVWDDRELEEQCASLASDIRQGIARYAWRGDHYAYEVDGLGGVLDMDDANMPSLLSLPLTSCVPVSNPAYQATREWVLSPKNPYFYEGSCARGVGSPHTPPGYVWHIALAVEGLTGSVQQARDCLATILATDAGTGMTHESFDPDDPTRFTRPWFSWSNSMACELMMTIAQQPSS